MDYLPKDDTNYLELSDETKAFVERELRAADTEQTGELSGEQLERCLRLVGYCPTDDDVRFLLKHFDANGDGRLQIRELVDNLHVIHAHSLNREELIKAFKVFDRDGDGFIRCAELVRALTYNNGFSVADARALTDHLIRTFDRNGDGKLDYSEFVEIFMSMQYPFSPAAALAGDDEDRLRAREQMLKHELDGT